MTRSPFLIAFLVGLTLTSSGRLGAQNTSKTDPAESARLPEGAIHRFGNRQLRHPEPIVSAIASRDGKYLATAGESSVVVWDLKSLAPKCVLPGQPVTDPSERGGSVMFFFPDSKSLLVAVTPERARPRAADEKKVDFARVFDLESGKLRFALTAEPGTDPVVWLDAEGKEIGALNGESLAFWSAADGKELRTSTVDLRPGMSPSGTAAGRIAFWQSSRSTVTVVDMAAKKELFTTEPMRDFRQAILSPDGKILTCLDAENKIVIHDVEAKKAIHKFEQRFGRLPPPLAVSADRSRLYLSGERGEIASWDLTSGRRLTDVGRNGAGRLTDLVISPDGSTLFSVGDDQMIRRWDLKENKEIPLPSGYVGQTAIAVTPDGQHLVIADQVGRIDLWDLGTGRIAKNLQPTDTGGINALAVSPDGRWLACGRTVPEVQLWDLRAGKVERVFRLFEKSDEDDVVQRLAFSPDSRVLFAGINGIGPTACEVPSGKRLWNYNGGGYNLTADPRGRFVATGKNGRPTVVTILDAATGAPLRSMALDGEPADDDRRSDITTVDRAFTPDGSRLVTYHEDGSIRAWNPTTGREVARIRSPTDGDWRPGGLAVSADGKWVGVRENRPTRTMLIFELASGKQVYSITGHDSLVRELAFTRDGRGIVGNADLAPILWSLAPRELPKLDGSADAMWEALVSDDGASVYRLQWALARDPKAAVALLGSKVNVNDLTVDVSRFNKWVAELNSPRFRTREASEKQMAQAGFRVPVEWLVRALGEAKSEEVRTRLERLLALRERPGPEEWRLSRAVQILELAGTDEARALLKSWAAIDGTALGTDAKSALNRLRK